jgi:CIC family chloride channel protein
VGLLALELPEVLGGGYGWIQQAIEGRLTVGLLCFLLFAKVLAFALTVSSGGSGGVFAPSLFVGAMLGGLLAALFHQPPAAFVVVGMAAVFGGAARVPMATLLMVTEMTGGYHLLVPATLAVMLSYLVQVTLSASLTYKSLYEAQVPRRSDSPAHHAEHLRVALSLLGKRQLPAPDTIGHVDLLALLASGIPVDLSDGKQLTLRVLRAESPWVGQSIRSGCLVEARDDLEIMAIVRQGQMLLPHPDSVLRAEDQLLVITSSRARARLGEH